MIDVRPLTDMALIAATMRHPKVYPWIRDDGCPLIAEEWNPAPPCAGVHYLGAYRDEQFLGLWMFHRRNHATWEVHTCLLPVAYGGTGFAAANAAREWFWRREPEAYRLVTVVPETNGLALRFAERIGMERWGRNPRAFRVGGRLIDEIWLGMSRQEVA